MFSISDESLSSLSESTNIEILKEESEEITVLKLAR